ncbi:non-homologous end-joining factor 1-like [Diadema setosum]|uniref:non-homologous end-joining factor 1-like n=1 Tax=Diadema setosum TaxID=31175 RepID=UPI003B3AF8AB
MGDGDGISETEWRRRWAPDLSALPWVPFTINGTSLMVKSHFSDSSYTVLVYDYASVWQEECSADCVQTRAKECNPNVEAPISKLLQHLGELLGEPQKSAKYSLSYPHQRQGDRRLGTLIVKVASKLAQGVPFSWDLSLLRASDEVASTHLTIPLLTLVSELMRRERELQRLMKRKDEEIEDYKMSGAKISRKHKLTQVFDGKAFNQEMVQSKAFKAEVEAGGKRAFSSQGQDLYKEVMVTRAWLNRPVDKVVLSEEDNDSNDDAGPSATNRGSGVPLWMTGAPRATPIDVPMTTETPSPAKSSPSKSPTKPAPSASTQETELMRREALEKKLAEEKLKLQSKKKKKKLF